MEQRAVRSITPVRCDAQGEPILPHDLGDGLVLRRASAADVEPLAALGASVHAPRWADVVATWVRDLLRGDHPAGTADNVLLVEETRRGVPVATASLIEQTWAYGGVSFPAGRPELIGTAPEYRRRGLIRAMLEVIHAWGARRGHLLQMITGIPYFYRQFGYEPALGVPSFGGPVTGVPRLAKDAAEPYRLRPATEADLPFIAAMAEQANRRSLVTCRRDAALWRYEFFVRDRGSDYTQYARVIETPDGEAVGVAVHWTWIERRRLEAILCEIVHDRAWSEIAPSLLRGLRATGVAMAAQEEPPTTLETLGFTLPPGHPLVTLYPDWLRRDRRDYYLYIRVGDVAAFLRRVAPVLERRLAASPLAGFSGDLALSFYRDGVTLRFVAGRVVAVKTWTPSTEQSGDAAFPDRTFLQVLLGTRSLDALEDAYPDCIVSPNQTRALVTTLFPLEPSVPWPIG